MQKDARQREDTQNDAMPSKPVGKPKSVRTSLLSKISTIPAEAQRHYVLVHFTYGAMQTQQSIARTKRQPWNGQCKQHQCCRLLLVSNNKNNLQAFQLTVLARYLLGVPLLVNDITNSVITWLSAYPMLLGPHLLPTPSPAASSIKAC